MFNFHYGKGNCGIEGGGNVAGVQIRYEGVVEIHDATPDGVEMFVGNGMILIISLSQNVKLNELFTYIGKFVVNSVIIADASGNKLDVRIHESTDYSQNIKSKSEDMTIKSEDMNAGFTNIGRRYKTTLDKTIIENLHTNKEGDLYLEDGTAYNGAYHIHKNNSMAMSGAVHEEGSQQLYTKNKITGKIIPTKDAHKRLKIQRPYVRKTKGDY